MLRSFKLRSRQERGMFLPLWIGIFFGVLAVLGLAVDIVVLYRADINLQKAVDGGSLSGANLILKPLGSTEEQVEAAAEAMTRTNLQLAGFASTDVVSVSAAYNQDSTPGGQPGDSTLTVSAALRPQLLILSKIPGFGASVVRTAQAVSRTRSAIVMVVLDTSGSMNATLPGDSNNKLFYLKQAATNFVQRFEQTRDMVGLVTFNTGSSTLVPLNDFNDDAAEFSANRAALQSAITALSPGGATNHSSALYRAWDGMRDRVTAYPLLPRFVVLFTDGASTASSANWKPNFLASPAGFTLFGTNQRPDPSATPHPWFFNAPNEGDNADGTNYWYDLIGAGVNARCLYNNGSTWGLYHVRQSFASGSNQSPRCGASASAFMRDCFGLGSSLEFYDPNGKLYIEPGSIIPPSDENTAECYGPTLYTNPSLPMWDYARLHYLASVASADFLRNKGVQLYVIGLGQQDTDTTSFYQSLNAPDLRKDYALNRIANDQQRAATGSYPDMPGSKAPSYTAIASMPHGKYFPTDRGEELDALFQAIFRDIKLQLLR